MSLGNDIAYLNKAREESIEPFMDICRPFEGRLEWGGNFHEGGPRCSLTAHRPMAHARLAHITSGFTDPDITHDAMNTLEDLKGGNVASLVRNLSYLHMGSVGASDASTADGLGTHSGGVVACGMWEPETAEAIQRSKDKETHGGKVPISPLELLKVAMKIVVTVETHAETIRKEWKALGQIGNPQLFLRFDNQCTVYAPESRRAYSPSMRAALAIVQGVEKTYGIFIRLGHIASEDNIIADSLCHNDMEIPRTIFNKAGRGMRLFPMHTNMRRINGSLQDFARQVERTVRAAILAGL